MLERVTDYLVGRVSESNYFQKIFPFVELIEKEDTMRPAEYIGKGQYSDVTRFDNYDGMAYFRMTGKERITKDNVDALDLASCDQKLTVVFPMRIVACVPKSSASKDDAFTDERISRTLMAHLLTDGGALKDDLRATSVKIFPESITFSNKEILSEEYRGLEKLQDINYEFSYHAIDFSVTIKIKESCLTAECQEAYYG